jgi:hypothetical protein
MSLRATLAALAIAMSISGRVGAVTITYQATDLADAVAGQDLWRYTYTVSGSFVLSGGFNILFDPGLYSNLQDPPPAVNGDWMVLITQPDTVLGADGIYSATVIGAPPSLADVFSVEFIWLGSGSPGSQPFEAFDDTFQKIQDGRTALPGQPGTPAPLPGTLALLGIGAVGMAFRRHKRVVNRERK